MSVGRVCEGTGRFLHWNKEGGSWGKHGFPHGSESKTSDAHFRTGNHRPQPVTLAALLDGPVRQERRRHAHSEGEGDVLSAAPGREGKDERAGEEERPPGADPA
jgi:hypothetical protein